MRISDIFAFKKKAVSVQTAQEKAHPYSPWLSEMTFGGADCKMYSAIRQSVPIVDAAIDKIIRLTTGFEVKCCGGKNQKLLDEFVENVKVGPAAVGLHQFINSYFDSLLTFGNAVGEMVLDSDGKLCALYNAPLENIRIVKGDNPLDMKICASSDGFSYEPVKYQQLILFTPLAPKAGEVKGQSILSSLPFVTDILLKIYNSVGTNFERVANLRYAITYKPGNSGIDKAHAKEIAQNIADEWADAVASGKDGVIKDFVAVGDVEIKVIGAENQMIDTEVPVRQMLEHIVAKLGIPPFMLGLHWSTTERMSSQQADILTSELKSYRKLLEGVIKRICTTYLRLLGIGCEVFVEWDNINLQDELESANARLVNAQALCLENEKKEEKKNET